MRLRDLNAGWYGANGLPHREGLGIFFDCPCCAAAGKPEGEREVLAVPFANPLDGGPPMDAGRPLWQRAGDTLDNLTLHPSIDASGFGHWHGWILLGETR